MITVAPGRQYATLEQVCGKVGRSVSDKCTRLLVGGGNMARLAKLLCVSVLAAALVACTAVPQAEFKAYTDAFNDTKSASEQWLTEYAQARQIQADKKAAEERSRSGVGQPVAATEPYPTPAAIAALVTGEPADPVVAQRRRALEVIARYDDLMLTLAAGKSAAEVRSSADSLIDAVNSIGTLLSLAIPAVPVPVLNLATTLIGELQAADNRAQFVKALQTGEPVIQAIFGLFKQDAADLYKIRFAQTTELVDEHVVDIRIMEQQLVDVAGGFKAPAGAFQKSFGDLEEQLESTLAPMGMAGPQAWKSNQTGPDFSALALSQLQQTGTQIASEVQKIVALQTAQKAYAAFTVSYIIMLNQTAASLSKVRLALDNPAEIKAQALSLIAVAFDVKKNIEALRASRKGGG